jgi:hypothetical protein
VIVVVGAPELQHVIDGEPALLYGAHAALYQLVAEVLPWSTLLETFI